MNYPLISIAIATFNSELTLPKTLESIKKQDYPQNKIEILVIDGGSTDETLSIAKKYNCKILQNPKTELVFAKHIGFLKAVGKFLLYLDSDEVLENHHSLKLKYQAIRKDNRIKAVIPTGYKTSLGYSPINYYINEFGDPFTFFVYRESKGDNFAMKDWPDKYGKVFEDKNCIIFSFFDPKQLPLIELWAGGCVIDLQFTRLSFPQIKTNPALIAHLFYLLNGQNCLLAITKNDYTTHYSSQNFYKYLKKITSRIKNNIYYNPMGEGGFLGREQFQPSWFHLKKYLFIPYSLSIMFPLIDSIYLVITRKKFIYLVHLPLCIYTSLLIIYYYFLKLFGLKPQIKTYGN